MRRLGHWLVYRVYRPYLLRFPFFESCAYLLKYLLLPWLRGRGNAAYRAPGWHREERPLTRPVKIALIADGMTEQNFRTFAEVVELTPQNWIRQMEEHHPDILVCESACHGRDGCWDYRIHRNKRLLFDNRTALKRILRYCAAAGMPTFFWNKEDPTFFDDPVNSFSDTATLFDTASPIRRRSSTGYLPLRRSVSPGIGPWAVRRIRCFSGFLPSFSPRCRWRTGRTARPFSAAGTQTGRSAARQCGRCSASCWIRDWSWSSTIDTGTHRRKTTVSRRNSIVSVSRRFPTTGSGRSFAMRLTPSAFPRKRSRRPCLPGGMWR